MNAVFLCFDHFSTEPVGTESAEVLNALRLESLGHKTAEKSYGSGGGSDEPLTP